MCCKEGCLESLLQKLPAELFFLFFVFFYWPTCRIVQTVKQDVGLTTALVAMPTMPPRLGIEAYAYGYTSEEDSLETAGVFSN